MQASAHATLPQVDQLCRGQNAHDVALPKHLLSPAPEIFGSAFAPKNSNGAAMHDMQTHLQKLRLQLAECEMIRDLATDPVKRDLFATLAEHFKTLAAQIELTIGGCGPADTFLGRKTQEPFPNED